MKLNTEDKNYWLFGGLIIGVFLWLCISINTGEVDSRFGLQNRMSMEHPVLVVENNIQNAIPVQIPVLPDYQECWVSGTDKLYIRSYNQDYLILLSDILTRHKLIDCKNKFLHYKPFLLEPDFYYCKTIAKNTELILIC